jgi:DNA-binding transcriptional LysR family regulator
VLPPNAPDLTALDLLNSIAELGSQVTQPAVSMRMRQLERRLDLTLLERGPAGTRLTADGQRVLTACRKVLAETEILMATAAALRSDTPSRVQVAASLTIAEYLIPGWIRILTSEFPQLGLSLDVVNTASVIERVRNGFADIGFIEGVESGLAGLDESIVGQDKLEVVVAPSHPWARRTVPISPAELAASDIITREPGSGTREVLEASLAPWGGVRSRVVMGSTGALLGAARRGGDPAVLSQIAVATDIAEGQLVAVLIDGLDLSRVFKAVWRPQGGLTSTARRLRDIAIDPASASRNHQEGLG